MSAAGRFDFEIEKRNSAVKVKNMHSLFVLLQFSIQPAVSFFRDQQCDDVTLLEAQKGVVVSRFVGKYGAHFWSFVYVIEASGH